MTTFADNKVNMDHLMKSVSEKLLKGENAGYKRSPFSRMFSKVFLKVVKTLTNVQNTCIIYASKSAQIIRLININPFSKRQFFYSSKLKEFADDNCKFDKNGRKVFKWEENTMGKRRNCSLRAFFSFPTVFSKKLMLQIVKTRACLEKGSSWTEGK